MRLLLSYNIIMGREKEEPASQVLGTALRKYE